MFLRDCTVSEKLVNVFVLEKQEHVHTRASLGTIATAQYYKARMNEKALCSHVRTHIRTKQANHSVQGLTGYILFLTKHSEYTNMITINTNCRTGQDTYKMGEERRHENSQ